MIVREEKGHPFTSPSDTCDEEKPTAHRPSRYSYIHQYHGSLPGTLYYGSLLGTLFRSITLAHAFIVWSVYLIHGLLYIIERGREPTQVTRIFDPFCYTLIPVTGSGAVGIGQSDSINLR